MCKHFFDDKQDVVTALNNGMLNVYKRIGQYDATKGDFFNWIYTVVRNAALTLLRDKKMVPTVSLLYVEDKTAEIKEVDSNFETLTIMLQHLPAATRIVAHMYYREGFSIKEIATHVDTSEGTVKWHLSETRKRLKQMIANQDS